MKNRSAAAACWALGAILFVACSDDGANSGPGGVSGASGSSATGIAGANNAAGGHAGSRAGAAGEGPLDAAGIAGQGVAGDEGGSADGPVGDLSGGGASVGGYGMSQAGRGASSSGGSIGGASTGGASGGGAGASGAPEGSVGGSGGGSGGISSNVGGFSGNGASDQGGNSGSGGSVPQVACTLCPPGKSVKLLGFGLGCVSDAEWNSPAFGCGTSTVACALAHATPTCSGNACAVDHCDAGWDNCDNDSSNGCETDLRLPSSCKTCGTVCAPGSVCTASGCAASCPTGTSSCSGACTDLETSADHCGICSYSCPANQSCSGGDCVPGGCNPGLPNSDACGASCQVCPSPLGTVATPAQQARACVAGECRMECTVGWENASGGCGGPFPRTTPIVLAHNLNAPNDIVADASDVYWADTGDSSIWQIGINGGSPTQIASGQANPAFIAIGDAYVYWITPTGIQRVHKGGGSVQTVITVQDPQGVSVAGGEAVTYVAGGTFYSVDGAGGVPTTLGTPSTTMPTIGINSSVKARLAGTQFYDGYKLWTPTGAVAVGGGVSVLGRNGEYLRLGGAFLGASTPLNLLVGSKDVSGVFYFTNTGIGWALGNQTQLLLAATTVPRHLFAANDAVYWTDDRSVLKALICTGAVSP